MHRRKKKKKIRVKSLKRFITFVDERERERYTRDKAPMAFP